MTPEETAERLEAATADAREVLAEVRSELKEARRVRRDFDAAVDALEGRLRDTVDQEIAEHIRHGLEQYSATIKSATSAAHDRVIDQMTRLANLAMYGNEQGRGPNIFDELRAKIDGDALPPGPVTRRARGGRR